MARLSMATAAALVCMNISSIAAAQEPRLVRDASADTAPVGAVVHVLQSEILGEARRISVATPASYETSGPDRRYPVIIAFDGEYKHTAVIDAARYLAAEGQIPECLVVGVDNVAGPTERVYDLTPPGLSVSGSDREQGGERFLDFLELELVPALARQFRAGPPNVLVGHSSGGVLATWAAATRPGAYPFVVAIDTPTNLDRGWLADRFIERAARAPVRFLRYASLESRFGWSDDHWAALLAAAPATWKLYREKLDHETHNSMKLLATYVGLREVFADYSMLAAPDSPTSAALEHYRKYNEASGLDLVPPRSLLERIIEDLLMEGRADLAGGALDALVDGYGDVPRVDDLHRRIAEAAALPPLEATVEDLLATPMPTADQIAPFLGEWRGETGNRDRHDMKPAVLRLQINDGRAAGEWIVSPEPGVELVRPLQYLTVVDGGLHFGVMNGMRPRGMLVFEGVLRDDVLEGEMRMRGIRFEMPPGMSPPVISFTLRHERSGAR